jgi:transcriptional regulator with XRE-family HTH domain
MNNNLNHSNSRRATPIDKYVSSQIVIRRQESKLTLEELARLLGITFQQVQKYENGSNRISSSRLYELARIFGCKISSFFPNNEDIEEDKLSNISKAKIFMAKAINILESEE